MLRRDTSPSPHSSATVGRTTARGTRVTMRPRSVAASARTAGSVETQPTRRASSAITGPLYAGSCPSSLPPKPWPPGRGRATSRSVCPPTSRRCRTSGRTLRSTMAASSNARRRSSWPRPASRRSPRTVDRAPRPWSALGRARHGHSFGGPATHCRRRGHRHPPPHAHRPPPAARPSPPPGRLLVAAPRRPPGAHGPPPAVLTDNLRFFRRGTLAVGGVASPHVEGLQTRQRPRRSPSDPRWRGSHWARTTSSPA